MVSIKHLAQKHKPIIQVHQNILHVNMSPFQITYLLKGEGWRYYIN